MEEQKEIAPAQAQGLKRILEDRRINEGARVLDLASGIGRISINLAKLGYHVVGVDISPLYLEQAEKWATKEGVEGNVQFYRMDLRDAPRQLPKKGEEKFDAVINVGTAMGYYGEDDDLRTFSDLREITHTQSLLVVETVNRDYLVKNFQSFSVSRMGGIELHDSRELNLETSFMENSWKFYRRQRGSLKLLSDVPVSHRVYSLHELKSLLESAGWKYLKSYGKLSELTPFSVDSFHMTVVSQKR
jgi:SAM-dependent methyltransferase